jgi:uracil-DNA glycosylase
VSIKDKILKYQQKCFRKYSNDIRIPSNYTYPDGNPIRPLPPVKTTTKSLMIVGAYPSARFEYRRAKKKPHRNRLIPVADNLQPFGYEQYFDGVRVRTLESADGLDKYLMSKIGLTMDDCWITDLVKVFLYKPAHADSCNAVDSRLHVQVLRNQFLQLGRKSLEWLREECELCRPKLIVTLGQEVAQVVSGKHKASADKLLSQPASTPESLGGHPVLYLPHPDACRRSDKWRRKMTARVRLIKKHL